MKSALKWWPIAAWVLGFSLSQALAQTTPPSILEQAVEIRQSSLDSPPEFLCFSPSQQPHAHTWKTELRNSLNWPETVDFKLISQHTDKKGALHARFQPLLDGFPIVGKQWVLHQHNAQIYAMHGDLPTLTPNSKLAPRTSSSIPGSEFRIPSITEDAARNFAIGNSPAQCYAWDDAPQQFPWPQGEPVWFPLKNNSLRLAWRFDIYRFSPHKREWIFVDATNGRILARWNRLHSADVPAQAHTLYDGTAGITTDSISPGRYRLQASNRGQGIFTYDLRQGTDFTQAFDFENTTQVWNAANDRDKAGWSAHFAVEKTYDYFSQIWNRNSYDNAGAPLISYAHFDQDLGNAFWNGQAMLLGDGNGSTTFPFVSPDIVAHEFTHGVTDQTAALIYSGESGALNEMFSDVFGVLTEAWARRQPTEWVFGAELNTQSGIRSLEDPQRFNHPDTYQGLFWFTGTADDGGVHTNCGVGNYWFYLLAEGGQGVNDNGQFYTISGLGADTAAAIAYRTLTVYLTPSSDYDDARDYSIRAAEDLYGACSNSARTVAAAWRAVGVGGAYTGSVQASFVVQPQAACDTPATIQFTNQSQNGSTYAWDFGDGSSSSQNQPTHTYRQAGSYTVRLIATNPVTCNIADTLYKAISIQAAASTSTSPCSPTTQQPNASRGIFQVRLHTLARASVGSPESYQDISCSKRITLDEGQAYPLSITTGVDTVEQITVWVDWNADGDFNDIHEEVLRSSALRNHFDSLIVPASAPNQPLRMRIRSEASGTIAGPCELPRQGQIEDYAIIVRPGNQRPQPAFRSDKRVAGVGERIHLEDRSLGAPTSWNWNLTGATPFSSTQDTLSLQYNAPGIYPVKLSVRNALGVDSMEAVDYFDILPVYQLGTQALASDTAGIVYDDGGANGNYSNSANFSFTIAPPCARWVELVFTAIDLEQCCDLITVYDGPDASAPVLLVATGTTVPPLVRSTSGSLTIVLQSNATTNGAGFAARWRAEAPPAQAPVAAFSISPNTIPFNSTITFTDQSSNDTRDWFWDFGDGTLDTGAVVSHNYPAPGQRTVQLIADNCTGRDTFSQIITVQGPPQLSLNPDSLFAQLASCEDTIYQTITLYNTGAGDLVVRGTELPKDPSQLDSVRSRFNRNHPSLTSLIPGRFDFSGGVFGTNINDGGRDMFDQGNILMTNLDSPVFYFDNFIIPSPTFGPTGAYLTRKVPGLFMLAADLDGISTFGIRGGLGADGNGSVDGASLYLNKKGTGYSIFTKRVYDAVDPSVNHLILVEDRVGLSHIYPNNTDSDNHTIRGLDNSRRLYYLLFAGENGRYYSDSLMTVLADRFLDIISPGPDYLLFYPDSTTIAPGDSVDIMVQQMSNGLPNGRYETDILFQTNDPQIQDTIVPCILDIEGDAAVSTSADSISFGHVPTRGSLSLPWTITNTGCDTLILHSLISDSAAFTTSPLPAVLMPGASDTVLITFSPTQSRNYIGTATLATSADTLSPIFLGTGMPAAFAQWNPDSIHLTFNTCDDSISLPLTIYNRGDTILDVEAQSISDTLHVLALTYGVDLLEEYANTLQAVQDAGITFTVQASSTTDPDSVQRLLMDKNLLLIPEIETGFPTVWLGLRATVQKYVEQGGNVLALASLAGGSAPLFNLGLIDGFYRGGGNGQANITKPAEAIAQGLPRRFGLPQNVALLEVTNTDYVSVATMQSGLNSYDVAGYRHVGQGLIVMLGMDFWQRNTEADLLLANAFRWAGNGGMVPWISLAAGGQQLAAQDSLGLMVSVSGIGLQAGAYIGDLLLSTNDPVTPVVRVPVSLKITGSAAISLSDSCFDFGQIGQFRDAVDTLILTNSGCDSLFIDSLSLGPNGFVVDSLSALLLPGEEDTLLIRFEPLLLGSYNDTIRIFSSIGDTLICLAGEGTPVPSTSLSPDTINALVQSCTDTSTFSLWIHNTGPVSTTYEAIAGRGRRSNDILVVEDLLPYGVNIAALVRQLSGQPVRTIASSALDQTDLSQFGWIIFIGDQTNPYYTSLVRNQARLEQFVEDGGLLQLHLATRGVNLRLPGNLTSMDTNRETSNDILVPTHPALQGLASPLLGNMANHGYFSSLPTDATILTQTSRSLLPTTVEYNLGRGYVLATTMTWEYLHGQSTLGSQPLLDNALRHMYEELGASPSWLCLAPDSGTVAALDSIEVAVKIFPAGLNSGLYSTNIAVLTEDPLNPLRLATLNMDLRGQPDFQVQDTCIYFTPTRENTQALDTLWISNPGCDTLKLFSSVSNIPFGVVQDTLCVAAGEEKALVISFSPLTPGIFNDTLVMRSNVGDSLICLEGEGLGTPRWQWQDDTVEISLRICQDSAQTTAILESIGTAPLAYVLPGDPQADSMDILVLTYGVDTLGTAFGRMQQVLQQQAPRHRWNQRYITDASLLQAALTTANACIIPPLSEGGIAVWNSLGPVLQQYAAQGGGIIWCGSDYLQASPLFNTGLVSGSFGGRLTAGALIETVNPQHPVTQGFVSGFNLNQTSYYLNNANNLQPLLRFRQGATDFTVAGYRTLGMGTVVWTGGSLQTADQWLDSTFSRAVRWASGYLPHTWWHVQGQGSILAGGQQAIPVTVYANNLLPGVYYDHLPVATNAPDSATALLTVKLMLVDDPCAEITFDPLDICDGTVQFIATGGQPGDVQRWRFGMTDTAQGISPVYTFSGSGSYDVRLITEKDGVSDTTITSVDIPVRLDAAFSYTGDLFAGELLSFSADSIRPAQFMWDWGDGNVGNFSQTSHRYQQSGTYNVVLSVIDSLGCEADSSQTLILDFGVGNDPLSDSPLLNVFPNPFTEQVWLRWETPIRSANICLYDAQGREVYCKEAQGNQHRITTSTLAKGIYTLYVQLGETVLTRKVVKQ